MNSSHLAHCYKCNTPFEFNPNYKIPREEDCSHCKARLHCCKMCQFFDTSCYNECHEPVAERIVDKEKANFCDFFKVGIGERKSKDKNELFNLANSLFKK